MKKRPSRRGKLSVGFLFDDTLDSSDGVAQYVKTLGGWLSGRGHDVSYFVGETRLRDWQGGKVYSLSKNLKVVFNGNRMSVPLGASARAINRALERARPDILHVQMPHSPLMSQRVINRAGLPALGTFHVFPAGWLTTAGTKLLRVAYLRGLKRIDKVVSVSPAAQAFARSAFGLSTEVMPNMVDISRFQGRSRSNQPRQIVFLGRLVRRKGCEDLIKAFSIIHRQVPDSRLLIGGDGPQRGELEALVRRLGVAGAVDFKGFIDEADKPDFLGSAAVACFPSLYGESFGIVLVEAMAAGAGVVLAADNPGYAGVLAESPSALFRRGDPQDLAVKLLHFLRDKPAAIAVHTEQADLVKQFDVEVVGPRIEQIYHQLIAKRGQKRHN